MGINLMRATFGQAEVSPKQQADQLLRQARAAMRDGKLDVARHSLEKLKATGVRYERTLNPFSDSPDKLEKDLIKLEKVAGIQPKQPPAKSVPPSLPPNMANQARAINVPPGQPVGQPLAAPNGSIVNPYVRGAAPAGGVAGATAGGNVQYSGSNFTAQNGSTGPAIQTQGLQYELAPGQAGTTGNPSGATNGQRQPAQMAPQKAEALRLIANANLALSRRDIRSAERFAQQAHSLRVPDNAFGPNEQRPWMVLLEIDRAKRQLGSPAANASPANAVSSDFGASQAVYEQQGSDQGVRPAAATVTVSDQRLAQLENAPNVPNPFGNDSDTAANARVVKGGFELLKEGEEALRDDDLE